MLDLTRRLMWFFVVASAIAYSVFLLAGNAIHTQALGDTRVVLVRDYLKVGEHHLSGMVMVPSTCLQLSVSTREVEPSVYLLAFKTWEQPYVDCVDEDTPRAFRAVVFAPSVGIRFLGTLDGAPLELAVTLATEHRY
jgi:hypothetical protein